MIWLALPVRSATAVSGKTTISPTAKVEAAKPNKPVATAAEPTANFLIVEITILRGQ